MKLTPLLLLVGLMMTSSGCFTYRLQNKAVVPGEEKSQWLSYFLWGAVGEAELDARTLCTGEVAEVSMGTNGFTWLVGLLTIGIYSPRMVYVRCGAGTQQASAGGAR